METAKETSPARECQKSRRGGYSERALACAWRCILAMPNELYKFLSLTRISKSTFPSSIVLFHRTTLLQGQGHDVFPLHLRFSSAPERALYRDTCESRRQLAFGEKRRQRKPTSLKIVCQEPSYCSSNASSRFFSSLPCKQPAPRPTFLKLCIYLGMAPCTVPLAASSPPSRAALSA